MLAGLSVVRSIAMQSGLRAIRSAGWYRQPSGRSARIAWPEQPNSTMRSPGRSRAAILT